MWSLYCIYDVTIFKYGLAGLCSVNADSLDNSQMHTVSAPKHDTQKLRLSPTHLLKIVFPQQESKLSRNSHFERRSDHSPVSLLQTEERGDIVSFELELHISFIQTGMKVS